MVPKDETRGAKAHTALRGVENVESIMSSTQKHCPSVNIRPFLKDVSCRWLKFVVPRLRVSPSIKAQKVLFRRFTGALSNSITSTSHFLDSLELLMARRGEERAAHGLMSHYASWQRGEFHYSVPLVRPTPCRHTRSMHAAAKSLHFRQRRVGHECLVPNWDRS